VIIDAVRCAKLALDRGIGGPVLAPSSYFMKSPPQQFTDDEAYELLEAFIRGVPEAAAAPPSAARTSESQPHAQAQSRATAKSRQT